MVNMLVIIAICIILIIDLNLFVGNKFKMTIIGIEFIGGLGNALFQFGFIYSLVCKYNCQFTITNLDSWFSPHQTVSYDWFKTMIKTRENYIPSSDFGNYLIYNESHPFIHDDTSVVDNTLFKGYYQCYSYIEPSIFRLIHSSLPKCNSCAIDDAIFIHVRLGDYTRIPEASLEDGYYTRALALFPQNIKIHVFSNDVMGAKDIVPNADEYIDTDEVTSLVHMTNYKSGGICANSSFSWWASQLNFSPCKKIVMPKTWGKNLPNQPIDLYPPNVYKV
jgi:hypothetical protein